MLKRFWIWVGQENNNRAILILFTAIGGLWIVFLWWEGRPVKPPEVSVVCRSEEGLQCPSGATPIGCAEISGVIEEKKKSCKELTVRPIMARSGGSCGRNAWEFTCVPK